MKSQQEAYLKKLRSTDATVAAAWDSIGKSAFKNPIKLKDSYAEIILPQYLSATAYEVAMLAGEKLTVSLTDTVNRSALFSSLYILELNNEVREVLKPDTLRTTFDHIAVKDERVMILIHPTVNYPAYYAISLQKKPSLAWPLQNTTYENIGSTWGDDRDDGARRHEGIDIFAPRGRKVLAVAKGSVSRAGNNTLGGKVIFLKPEDMAVNVYYAHLDTQYVTTRQRVSKGDTIGAVGNTGNAISTPPHLHFGIYARGGAVNPLPFIQEKTQSVLPENNKAYKPLLTGIKGLDLFTEPSVKSPAIRVKSNDTFYLKGIAQNFLRLEVKKVMLALRPSIPGKENF